MHLEKNQKISPDRATASDVTSSSLVPRVERDIIWIAGQTYLVRLVITNYQFQKHNVTSESASKSLRLNCSRKYDIEKLYLLKALADSATIFCKAEMAPQTISFSGS
jgi:hypothetical protein